MPSSMIHLHIARLVNDTRSPLYFVGSLAPDALDTREKDHTHLRDRPDRAEALAALARATNPADDFAEGVLLHLYADWRWDVTHLRRWLDTVEDKTDFTWVKGYRREIALASAWLYWNKAWAPPLWQAMEQVPARKYGALELIAPEDITDYITGSHAWIETQQASPPSEFYTPDMAEDFARETASSYQSWRKA